MARSLEDKDRKYHIQTENTAKQGSILFEALFSKTLVTCYAWLLVDTLQQISSHVSTGLCMTYH
jgi:hypothetical protein